MFHRDIQTPRRETVENATRSGVFSDEIRGVWIALETMSREFDLSSESKQKLRNKRRSKIYANLSQFRKKNIPCIIRN